MRELAGGDLTRLEEVANLPLIFVLNDLSYQKELSDYKKTLEYKGRGGK